MFVLYLEVAKGGQIRLRSQDEFSTLSEANRFGAEVRDVWNDLWGVVWEEVEPAHVKHRMAVLKAWAGAAPDGERLTMVIQRRLARNPRH